MTRGDRLAGSGRATHGGRERALARASNRFPGTCSLHRIWARSSTITNSGDSGMSRTEKRSETYIGTDGLVHENKTIQKEETR